MKRKISIFSRLIIWFKTTYYFISALKCVKYSQLLDSNDTIARIKSDKKSLIRFGDGEFNIISGRGIHYQSFSKELQLDLMNIIEEYIDNNKPKMYNLALPSQFFKCNGLKLLKRRVYVSSWSYSRWLFKKNYDCPVTYGDSFLFAKNNEPIYRQLWEDRKEVIFVHNNPLYAQQFSERYDITTRFVKIPSKNAYEKKSNIFEQICKEIKAGGDCDILILISAGPCGKVLVKELTEIGYIAYDTGHCWDDPLELLN